MLVARLALLAIAALAGCATPLTPEGRKELVRRSIHERHSWCIQTGDLYASIHGVDALKYYQCDANSDAECHNIGLEHNCSQWIAGGL